MCGTDDPYLVWHIHDNECVCALGTEMGDSGLCEKEKIAEININWLDTSPPFLADNSEGGVVEITVTSLKGESEILEAEIALATAYKPGTLEIEENDKVYTAAYLAPNLMDQDPTKNYSDFIIVT